MNITLEKAVANRLFLKWVDEIPDLDITYFGCKEFNLYPESFIKFRVNDFFISVIYEEDKHYKVQNIKLDVQAWKDINKALTEPYNYTEWRHFVVAVTTPMSEILERAEKEFDFSIPPSKVKVSDINYYQFYKDLGWLSGLNHNFEKEEADRLWANATAHNLSKKDYDKYVESILVGREHQTNHTKGQLLYILDKVIK